MRPHLVLFLRAPRFGAGKRRLARDVGEVAALRFERLMIARLLRRLGRDRRWRLRLAVTPESACRAARHWQPRAPVMGQGPGDLGERMRRAIMTCAGAPVVLIGADIPDVSARHIATALRRLGRQDLVFGPAADGGFWLIGARWPRLLPAIFTGVRWSSPYALADTLANVPPRLGAGFADRLEDVDDGAAWRRLAPRRGF